MWVNYDIGVDNQSYLSLSKMKKEADPLEEARREAAQEGDEKLAKALSPRQRIGMWNIDRLDEDEGPQFFDAPFTLDKAFANLSIDQDNGEVIYIDDPAEGCDVRFYKEGTGLATKYDASKMRLLKPSPLHEDEAVEAEWLDYVKKHPVPDCLNYYDYNHIASAFNGQAGTRNDDNEDDTRTSRRSANTQVSKSRTRKEHSDGADEGRPSVRERASSEEKHSRTRVSANEEDSEPEAKPRGESIRERLARRRAPVHDDSDDTEDED
jgi:hypothetical protein